ncbi:MAG: hypothetical protein QJR02_15935 [Sinobacteraceae bacterium]|nr:hypothetical protein [Nevskiaceae bacterium]
MIQAAFAHKPLGCGSRVNWWGVLGLGCMLASTAVTCAAIYLLVEAVR